MMGATQIQVDHLPIGDLHPDPANPRRISDEELESLTRSIRQFGMPEPIVARREDLTVIGGHQRLLAARRLGLKTVPVVLVEGRAVTLWVQVWGLALVFFFSFLWKAGGVSGVNSAWIQLLG